MQCPKCGNDRLRALDTRKKGNGIERVRICEDEDNMGCGKRFKTYEEITQVNWYNPKKGISEWIDPQEYKKKHKKNDIEGTSGIQNRIFNQ